jgi:N-methylhydantoinase B
MSTTRKGIVDPITLEILSHRLHQIAREMGITLERVGGTVNTTQQHDYMAALYTAIGDVLAAGESLGQHVACAGFAVKKIIERFEHGEGIYPDDIFLLNDPYLAAIHQSDVYLISPIHYQGRLMAWSATFVHVMDIGAMSPGGNSPGATDICHEGVRIPGIKLVERGKLRTDVFDAIVTMTRQPVMVGLDLKCEIAANNVAKARMQELIGTCGPELLEAVSEEIIRYTESVLRDRIREFADGSWSNSTLIQGQETWKMHLTLTKQGDRLIFDFTGSDKQAKTGINLPYHATFATCFAAVLSTIGFDIPKNHGAFAPIEVIAPLGTVVNVQYPGPVSLNTTSGGAAARYLAPSVLMQMLATSEHWRQEVMALNAGHRFARHAGVNQYGRYYVSSLSEGAIDGHGARATKDGVDSGGHGWSSCQNIEWVEQNFPILYLFRRHVRDGVGAGRFRGGAGAETALTVHDAPEGKIRGVALGVAGLRNSGQGVFGGLPGAPSLLVLKDGTNIWDSVERNQHPVDIEAMGGNSTLLPYCDFDLRTGSVLYMRMASGGGYGDPLDREPEAVQRDVVSGIISEEIAQEIYGVAMKNTNMTVDFSATNELRARIREQR